MFHKPTEEMADLPLARVKIEEICLFPGPFTMSFGFDPEPLLESIRTIGLINNPLLAESQDGNFQIITGYRRVGALRSLGRERVTCRLVPELQPLDALLMNFHDNLVSRKFNPVEKGMFLSRLSHYLPCRDILSNYMEPLELPRNAETLEDFAAFDRDLEGSLKTDLASGRLSVRAARLLLRMKSGDRTVFGRLLSELNLNINQQKQLIDYTYELAQINHSEMSTVIENEAIDEILVNTSMNLPQKGRAILGHLRRKRYPTLTGAEKTFREKVSRLHLPAKVNIQPPPHFESGEYRLEIRFRHGKELKAQVDHLAGIPALETLNDPWKGHDD